MIAVYYLELTDYFNDLEIFPARNQSFSVFDGHFNQECVFFVKKMSK